MWNSVKEQKYAKEKAKETQSLPDKLPSETTILDETKNLQQNGVIEQQEVVQPLKQSSLVNGEAKVEGQAPGAPPTPPSRPPLPTQESIEKYRWLSRGSSEDSSGPW